MAAVTVKQLIAFASRDKNVLLHGKHGVGKTALIHETFESQFGKKNVDWLYLNGSTLDPWLALIGIPKTMTNDKDEEVMRIIPPETMSSTIKAIYVDELNRAPKEVRNAIMELLQSKSINGRKFPNLRVVWSSINPGSDVYDVEQLDPAQEDRFHIQISLPYTVNLPFFKQAFGAEIGEAACRWWNTKLNNEQREFVSPRRLEYAVRGYLDGDSLSFYLSDKIKHSELSAELKKGAEAVTFMTMIKNFGDVELQKFFTAEKVMEKHKILEGDKDFFTQKILPNLKDSVIDD